MAVNVNVNGTLAVFNNVLLSVNGTSGIEINDYVQSISWTTGTQSEHVITLTQTGFPRAVNTVMATPSGSITFAPGAFQTFYQFLNDRYDYFTLQLTEFVTGNLAGAQQGILISNAKLDTLSGSSSASSPANMQTFSFKATQIEYL